MKIPYIHDEFYHNPRAASHVLPVLFELYKPSSVLDVGCGLGDWIFMAEKMGISDIVGIDGAYVDRNLLKIKESQFVERDLTKPFELNRRFDMAICLEVAEHLPETSADDLVSSITNHTDVVLFSAAIPGQTGQNHINEQWPEYWQKKFDNRGFVMLDIIRSKIWNNAEVDCWYRQNAFLIVKKGHPLAEGKSTEIMPLVHPEILSFYVKRLEKFQRINAHLKKRDLLGRLAGIFKSK